MKKNRILVLVVLAALLLSSLAARSAQAAPDATLTVTKIADTNDGACNADCSLREAIAAAASGDTIMFNPSLSNQTITLNPALGVLTIGKDLSINGSGLDPAISISGGGATRVISIQAGYTVSLITLRIIDGHSTTAQAAGVDNAGSLTINDVVLSGNSCTGVTGCAIRNLSTGLLTATNSTFASNTTSSFGGAIYNASSVDLTGCTFNSNSAVNGGAIYNDASGSLTIAASTFTGNTASNHGGAIYNNLSATSASITGSAFTSNIATNRGGAIYNKAPLTISTSTLTNNTATTLYGGAIYNESATINVTSSTFSGNSGNSGAAIFTGGSATVTIANSTLVSNLASANGGGVYLTGGTLNSINNSFSENGAVNGGGIFYTASTLNLTNSILANSASGADCYRQGGISGTNTNNLIETNASGINACQAPAIGGQDPLLGPLGLYGGSVLTLPLLPGSPALEAGDDPTCAASPVNNLDQRGRPRPAGGALDPANDVCDIGAFESTGFWIQYWSYDGQHGSNQSTPINTPFSKPLGARVFPIDSAEPVVGGKLVYTAPATGASATAVEPITLVAGSGSYGYAQVNVTANGTYGTYNVNLNGNGLWTISPNTPNGLDYELTNCKTNIVVQNTNDSGVGSLREALKCTCEGQVNTVTFDSALSGQTIRVETQLDIDPNRTVTIDGSALASPITISGDSDGDGNGDTGVFLIENNVTATFDNLQIVKGNADDGAGIRVWSGSSLTVNNSTFSENTATYGGGGIRMDDGSLGLTVAHSTFLLNSASSGAAIWGDGRVFPGGGCTVSSDYPLVITDTLIMTSTGVPVYYSGQVNIADSTISDSTGDSGLGAGLAIVEGQLIATGNTFARNQVVGGPAAIYFTKICDIPGGNLGVQLYNNTFSSNTSSRTILLSSSHDPITIVNNTFNENSGTMNREIVVAAPSMVIYNNIMANPLSSTDACNLSGGPVDMGNNLIEGAPGSCTAAYTGDPALGPLADNGGATQTHALGIASIAIDAGSAAQCPSTDQRSVTRGLDGDASGSGGCDIGAFELGELACNIQSTLEPHTLNFTGGVAAQVTNDGSNLECLRVTPFETSHPNATGVSGGPGIQTGSYWLIQGLLGDRSSDAAEDFLLNLTLPHNNLTDPKVCEWLNGTGPGFGWDCARTSFNATSVTRDGIDALSEWAVGDEVGPTNVALRALSAHSSSSGSVPVVGGLFVGLVLSAAILRQRRRRKQAEDQR